jgi:hypothetical protein
MKSKGAAKMAARFDLRIVVLIAAFPLAPSVTMMPQTTVRDKIARIVENEPRLVSLSLPSRRYPAKPPLYA